MSTSLAISIIIPVHQLNDDLDLCLQAIAEDEMLERVELVIVLDGISDQRDFFDGFGFPHLKIVPMSSNVGPARARNEGANNASTELLFFVDSDVAIHEDTLEGIITYFDSNQDVDALIGSYDDDPQVHTIVSRFRNLLHHYTHQQASESATTFWGACGAIRSAAFEDIGGFDESYQKPSIEDIELGYRLCEKDYQIVLKKDIQVKHLKHWSFINMVYTDIFRRAKPWTKLMLSNPQISQHDLNTKVAQRWASVFTLLLVSSIIASWLMSMFLLVSILSLAGIFYINYRFYYFLSNRFSYFELALVVVLHWVYYLSAMTGLILGSFDFWLSGKSSSQSFTNN